MICPWVIRVSRIQSMIWLTSSVHQPIAHLNRPQPPLRRTSNNFSPHHQRYRIKKRFELTIKKRRTPIVMKNSKKSLLQFVLMLLKMLQSGMELLVLAVNLVMPNMTMFQRYLTFFILDRFSKPVNAHTSMQNYKNGKHLKVWAIFRTFIFHMNCV